MNKINLKRFHVRIHEKIVFLKDLSCDQSVLIARPELTILPSSQSSSAGKFQHETWVSAVLGMTCLQECAYLVCVKQSEQVSVLENYIICKVKQVQTIPIGNKCEKPQALLQIQKLMTNNFYYSLEQDISLRMQRRNSPSSDSFSWNKSMREWFVSGKLGRWSPTVINGFVGNFAIVVKGQVIRYTLITRRSIQNQGQKISGLNDADKVSHFMETEQILQLGKETVSHCVVRGGVPLFWRARDKKVILTRNQDMSSVRFTRHLLKLSRGYGLIFLLSLLQDHGQEGQLLRKQQQLIKRNQGELIHFFRYLNFEISSEFKRQSFKAIEAVEKIVNPIALNMSCFRSIQGKIVASQKGVFRTACFDCMGKSNFFQSRICWMLLRSVLGKFVNQTLLLDFNSLWLANHQNLSRFGIYKEDMKINKNLRPLYFLESRFKYEPSVKKKQALFQLLAGSQNKSVDPNLEAITSIVSIFILTWNINGLRPDQVNLDKLFEDLKSQNLPDILVFGLQEMVPLNTKNIVVNSKTEKHSYQWRTVIKSQLAKKCGPSAEGYLVVQNQDMVGLFNLILVNQRIKSRVSEIENDSVMTGLGGKLGNKGAVMIRFKLDSNLISFVNCHLEAGQKKVQIRLQNINDIHQKSFLNAKKKSTLLESDYVFLYGDMNFRVARFDSSRKVIQGLNGFCEEVDVMHLDHVKNSIVKDLMRDDQLLNSKSSNSYLNKYFESDIEFLPTYKYERGSTKYTTHKERCPSWCDRILLYSNKDCFTQKSYFRKEMLQSDHRPVCAHFLIGTEKMQAAENLDLQKELQSVKQSSPLKSSSDTDS